MSTLNNMEPIFHSFIEDTLPEDHPLVWTTIICVTCAAYVHVDDECMGEWFETGVGALCVTCFVARIYLGDYDELALVRKK